MRFGRFRRSVGLDALQCTLCQTTTVSVIKGEQVSEKTKSMERAQTNLGRLSQMNVLFGGARGPANCVLGLRQLQTAIALVRKDKNTFAVICPATTIQYGICGSRDNRRLEHTASRSALGCGENV